MLLRGQQSFWEWSWRVHNSLAEGLAPGELLILRVLIVCQLVIQAVQSIGSEGALLQLLTQGLRGAKTTTLGLGVGPQPMAVMPDIKV